MDTTRTTKRCAVLALAAMVAGTAYGISATALEVTTPEPRDEQAATAIEYGLIAAALVNARGITFNGLD
jgi:hypothetical protein